MKRTFYAVITQYDCDPKKNPPGTDDGAKGPLLLERYLDNDSALSEESTREIAQRWEAAGGYGWARVATITIDIPEDESAQTPCPPDEGAPPGGEEHE